MKIQARLGSVVNLMGTPVSFSRSARNMVNAVRSASSWGSGNTKMAGQALEMPFYFFVVGGRHGAVAGVVGI